LTSQTDDNLLTSEQVPDLIAQCYPEGVPEGFPVDLFAPVPTVNANDFVARDLALQERITRFEQALLELPQADLPVDHKFADGVYARTLFMPRGTVATGRLHLRECINIMVSGDVTMLTVDGPVRVVAPQVFVSAPGTKKVGFVNEDTVWITTHSLPPTDPEKIPDLISVQGFAEYRALLGQSASEEDVCP